MKIKHDPTVYDEPIKKRGAGRPRKKQKQTPEERAAYQRAYHQRPEVIERRKAWMREYRKKKRDAETPEERQERLEYDRLWREAKREKETEEEREARLARQRAYQRNYKQRQKERAE